MSGPKQTTRWFRRDSYEAQLSGHEVRKLHDAIRKPGVRLALLARHCPRWRYGPEKGKRPCDQTLLRISRRLRAEDYLNNLSEKGHWLQLAHKKLLALPPFKNSQPVVDTLCSFIEQELLEDKLLQKETKDMLLKLKLLMKREDQTIALARFRRDTCQKFIEWHNNGRAREILNSRDSNAEKIQMLGKLIYGDAW